MPHADPIILNQIDFIPLDFPDDAQFIVQSSQQAPPLASLLGAQTATTQFVQASGVGSPSFSLQCTNSTAGAIMETGSGLALTAWPNVGNDFSAPVTYETYTGAPNQIWSFVTV